MSDESPAVECPICYEPLDQPNKAYFKASCNHAFHVACLNASVEAGNKSCCPYCRCNWETDRVVVRSCSTNESTTIIVESITHESDTNVHRREIEHFEQLFVKTLSMLKYPIVLMNFAFLAIFAHFVISMARETLLFGILSSWIFLLACVGQMRRVANASFVRDVLCARLARTVQDHISVCSFVCVQCTILAFQFLEPSLFVRVTIYFYLTFFQIIIVNIMRHEPTMRPMIDTYVIFCILSSFPFLRALYLADIVYAFVSIVFMLTPYIEDKVALQGDYVNLVPRRYVGYILFELLACVTNGIQLYKNVATL
jgi:hypothetical protein